MFKNLREDIDAMIARDPAARNRFEVALLYPGFQALLFYRLSHAFWARDWRLIGRGISQLGRWLTGIEIHPGAKIGRRFSSTTAWVWWSARPAKSAMTSRFTTA